MRLIASTIALTACFLAGGALAADGWTPYTQQAFEEAQAAGKTIVVDVHADWCPVCAKQAPILAEIIQSPELEEAAAIQVDFDADKDFLRQHNVTMQSTVLVLKDGAETARTTGETDPAKLRQSILDGVQG
ncbi:thioredoxin family protein [Marinivivus vitaminiproducens]|uniref:thioredoxin family protein n=1 Tax=Marinivivus vitaminiproducens TaxID=3035935 RepID=UPI00279FA1DE|nr:thioredoxin family protein [Geminicoccaceae bacterium SCSIO 64248]